MGAPAPTRARLCAACLNPTLCTPDPAHTFVRTLDFAVCAHGPVRMHLCAPLISLRVVNLAMQLAEGEPRRWGGAPPAAA